MKKLTREQKKKKKAKQRKMRASRRKVRREKQKVKPWQPVKMKIFQMSDPFPKDMSREKRIKMVRDWGHKANDDFNKKFPLIEKWFLKYDALYLLSFYVTYFLSSPEGVDPEATGDLDVPPYMLEIMQAFALINKRTITAKPLLEGVEEMHKEMKEIGELIKWRLVDIPKESSTDEDLETYRLRMEMMASTTAIRNWAYYHQIKRTVLDLAALMNGNFKKKFKLDLYEFFRLMFILTEERNDLLNDHLGKVRSFYKKSSYKDVVEAYEKSFPENKKISADELEELWVSVGENLDSLKSMLVYHSDLKLEDVYTFTLDHAVSLIGNKISKELLKKYLDRISYKFGDLKKQNKEYIILDNPVHHKPFIKVEEDSYFSSIWGVIPHIVLDMFESLISEDEELWKKYTGEIKSKYLEDKVEELFINGFPNAQILRGGIWNKNENDLLVIVDSFAIVVEDKAGLISPAVRRGAPKDLYETLKRLIEEPSEQALGFIDFLKKQKGSCVLQNKLGREIVVDMDKINYYIPLGVTFHHFGRISSNLKKLIDAKVVDKTIDQLVPSMSFTDLEVIFQLLPLEAEKVHYFVRRREFEAHMLYEGDELDLLGLYLENGFNIGNVEYSREVLLEMSLKSKELDPYIIGSAEGKKVQKPELTMSQWWKDLLGLIALKKIEGWMEASFILLNSTKEDQEKFESKFKELVKLILNGKIEKPHNWVMFFSGPSRRMYAIAGYPYVTTDKELRNNIMNKIVEDEGVKKTRGCVVIGVNIAKPNYPYTVFARKIDTDLFDTLPLEG